MTYQLTLTVPGQPPVHRTVTGTTPVDLAQAVHHHARGLLGAQVDVHLDGLAGTVHRGTACVGEFTLDPIKETAGTPGPGRDDGIRWGWTLAELDDVVRRAVTRTHQYRACDADERYATGWHAAVELLYTALDPPSERDLYCAAWRAADYLTTRTAEERGVARSRGDTYTGRMDLPKWHAYWETVTRHTAGPEEPVVERLALTQIWPRLHPRYQAALHALAVHENYYAAADALGLKHCTFYAQVRHARNAFLALWWEGETPRRGWRDRRATTEPTQLHSISAHVRKRRRAGVAA
ncbi:hypothetical protein [Streptomyces sp. SAJ15]|uniref:hypothetical protein n=1 Tax=Streptomyces sp. SAJ15 TaxID=2011095 RepID=UPI0011851C0F|nr:hypothetical protein [Streptomyces sp. SAJ15]TVL89804.1 hypothetical protein CD790_25755 [Streptomyces sp. SAJ15]